MNTSLIKIAVNNALDEAEMLGRPYSQFFVHYSSAFSRQVAEREERRRWDKEVKRIRSMVSDATTSAELDRPGPNFTQIEFRFDGVHKVCRSVYERPINR